MSEAQAVCLETGEALHQSVITSSDTHHLQSDVLDQKSSTSLGVEVGDVSGSHAPEESFVQDVEERTVLCDNGEDAMAPQNLVDKIEEKTLSTCLDAPCTYENEMEENIQEKLKLLKEESKECVEPQDSDSRNSLDVEPTTNLPNASGIVDGICNLDMERNASSSDHFGKCENPENDLRSAFSKEQNHISSHEVAVNEILSENSIEFPDVHLPPSLVEISTPVNGEGEDATNKQEMGEETQMCTRGNGMDSELQAPRGVSQNKENGHEVLSCEKRFGAIRGTPQYDAGSSRSSSGSNICTILKNETEQQVSNPADHLQEPDATDKESLQFLESFQKALLSAAAREQQATTSDHNSRTEDPQGRPLRRVKKGLSEKIKNIQEILQKEIASNEPRPKHRRPTDVEEVTASVSGRSMRRHQRSVSRSGRATSKIRRSRTPGKRERPFRHWLGVAKCVTPDCRFIISSKEDRKSLPSRTGTSHGLSLGKVCASGVGKTSKSVATITEEEGSAFLPTTSLSVWKGSISVDNEILSEDSSSMVCAQGSVDTLPTTGEFSKQLADSPNPFVASSALALSNISDIEADGLLSAASTESANIFISSVADAPIIDNSGVPVSETGCDTNAPSSNGSFSGNPNDVSGMNSAVVDLHLRDQPDATRDFLEADELGIAMTSSICDKVGASNVGPEFRKSQTLPASLRSVSATKAMGEANPLLQGHLTLVVTCPGRNADNGRLATDHKVKWKPLHEEHRPRQKRSGPFSDHFPNETAGAEQKCLRGSKVQQESDRDNLLSTLPHKPTLSMATDRICGPTYEDDASPIFYTARNSSPDQARVVRTMVRESTPYHPRPRYSTAVHRQEHFQGRMRRHSRGKDLSMSRVGVRVGSRSRHRAHSGITTQGSERLELGLKMDEEYDESPKAAGGKGVISRPQLVRPYDVSVFSPNNLSSTQQSGGSGKVLRSGVAEKLLLKVNRSQKKHNGRKYIAVKAIEDYAGTLPGQLSFKAGQIIKLKCPDKEPVDGLCYGYYRTGRLGKKRRGLFPLSCITTLDSDDE